MITTLANQFLNKIFTTLDRYNINISNHEIDHICYRTSSEENYESTKKSFQKIGNCLIESNVNGRLIATYKLFEPIVFREFIIDLVEVPAPKKGKVTKEGFEHIEVVTTSSFDELEKKYRHLPLSKKRNDKIFNAEFEIDFGEMAIKFHSMSLESVINIEKNELIECFLNESRILEKLASFFPQISGTFPIDIATETSDLDILFSANDLNVFTEELISQYGNFENFEIKKAIHQNVESVIAKFKYKSLKVECFCQNKWTLDQNANIHMLIEGRLLKLMPESFKDKVISLKKSGIKTEPAFGQILNLVNPYQDLLEIHRMSDLALKKKFTSQQETI